ncbi:MAG: aspartate 1-decarboxylase [Bacteroidetes Order II. Incertae sedis bacterium]|jgi:aspartate 1-decarboxylase|nr:aspartate 1-decarboxylase [Bacteroidetes Order II. bacterium]MDG1753367.1 aspartate 1-decarboxylase [Rhodothermales bacterium]HAY37250.1 aspartate 1-decarboxylase [Bacteroidota bacterium]MBT4052808.1 aspartate 1-decarboxylase [Bacteroidetes Order II. bacterium]MBT4603050.1 aspartate 1-decarboxylase [Bacteroidetes Order II. bacterium]
MTITLFKGKIHRAIVTQAELYYEGSITVDRELLELSGILPYEKVAVVNVNNGARLETYTIPAERGSGTICMNGPAARLAAKGDEVILISYAQMTPEEAKDHKATVVLVNEANRPKEILELPVYENEALPTVV